MTDTFVTLANAYRSYSDFVQRTERQDSYSLKSTLPANGGEMPLAHSIVLNPAVLLYLLSFAQPLRKTSVPNGPYLKSDSTPFTLESKANSKLFAKRRAGSGGRMPNCSGEIMN
jgi:hypothetical protein